MTQCIALLRGINVGRAKRIAMADLRSLIEELGFSNVRTILNSGNALFDAARAKPARIASSIEAAIQSRCGFSAAVIVITADELDAVIAENPLPRATADPSRFLIAFTADSALLHGAQPLLTESWKPESLAIGSRAAYLWCGRGIIESKLIPAFWRATGNATTTRNWATVLKLQAAAQASPGSARRKPVK